MTTINAMDNPNGHCNKCNLTINQNDNSISCAGKCDNRFHNKCVNLTTKDYVLVQNCNNLKWFCDHCLLHFELILNFKTEIASIKTQVTTELNEFRSIINNRCTNLSENFSETNKKSYANAAAGEVVIIKPKIKQECKKTKEAIQKNLKPAALEVGITQIKDIKEGGVVIKCKTKDEQEKIKKAAEKKLTKNYQITAPDLKNPCIKVVDIDEKYENEDLLNYIIKQNTYLNHDEMKMDVKIIKQMKKNYMAIIECDPLTCQMILKEQHLYINWSRCRVFEYVSVFRCFKCGGFNHHAENCSIGDKCLNCSKSDHKQEECVNDVICANCVEVNQKFKLDLNINHFIFDKSCPVYLKKVEKEKQKVKQINSN